MYSYSVSSAINSILLIYHHPLVFVLFCLFMVWASYTDFRTLKIKDYQNLSFLAAGIILGFVPKIGLPLGVHNLIGLVIGFLILFIPGMIVNHAFGGDIKFIAVMGFWVGPYAILLILIVSCVLQLGFLLFKKLTSKAITRKTNFPFAPAFSIAYLLLLGISLCLK